MFTAIDWVMNTKEAYFTSVVPYAVLDVSPLGGYLGPMEAHNGIHVVYRYILLDRFGSYNETFEVEEIRDPEWISEDHSGLCDGFKRLYLLFAYGHDQDGVASAQLQR